MNGEPFTPDVREHGRSPDGAELHSDRRLFMQLQVFSGCTDAQPLIAALSGSDHVGALYADVNNAAGVALLTATEDPAYLVTKLRARLQAPPFAGLQQRHDWTMIGRTYAIGYERDLDETLLQRPLRNVVNPDLPWCIWYPLRRNGAFALLPEGEQRAILGEHGMIGRAFGAAGLGHDVRLASFGLDHRDNDFVIGLIGPELHPLSVIVQTMRKTKQTSTYIAAMGPFFVGHVLWQSPAD